MSETREAYDGAPIIPWDEGSQEPFRVGYLIGVEAALDALKDEKLPNLPGLTFAKCVVENMLNSERITRLSAAYRHAVKHGVEPSMGVCEIRISARQLGKEVVLTVANQGWLAEASASTRLGLANTSKRLALLFGPGATCTLVEKDGWVIATITLPQEQA